MKVENEEEEEAASHQGSQHSEELPEVADILERQLRGRNRKPISKSWGSLLQKLITRRSNRRRGIAPEGEEGYVEFKGGRNGTNH
jgi:hypothetical protein